MGYVAVKELPVIEKVLDSVALRVFSEWLTFDDDYAGEYELTYAGRSARLSYESLESFEGVGNNELFTLLTHSFRQREIYLDGDWEDESDRLEFREIDMTLQSVFRDRVDEVSRYLLGV